MQLYALICADMDDDDIKTSVIFQHVSPLTHPAVRLALEDLWRQRDHDVIVAQLQRLLHELLLLALVRVADVNLLKRNVLRLEDALDVTLLAAHLTKTSQISA